MAPVAGDGIKSGSDGMTDQSTTPAIVRQGSSRRDFLRRSAVVGGTLVWTAPTVQSMAPAAYAAASTGSPKDYSYLFVCLDCTVDGLLKRCCVKFELNDDGTVASFEAGGSFSTPGCDGIAIAGGDPGCATAGQFDVVPINGAQKVQVRLLDTTCHLVAGTAFGKCGNPNNPKSGGACVAGTIQRNMATFDFCA